MPKAHRASYNNYLAFKSRLIAEAEAVVNNSEMAVDEAINRKKKKKVRKVSVMPCHHFTF